MDDAMVTSALRGAVDALSKQRLKPLLPVVSSLHDSPVSGAALTQVLRGLGDDDPALIALRIAFAKWDSDDSVDFTTDGAVSPAKTLPRTFERRHATYAALGLGAEAGSVLDERVPVYKSPHVVISKEFEPWYSQARSLRTSVYWDDYEEYLRTTKKWSADSIAALDLTTTDVVQRLSDPTRETAKQTKGLVVGYVQSGKTANFTGVVAKAIDAGYRLIIVLTGTIEILRAQTQRRLDMELIGRENILRGLDPKDPQVARELDYQSEHDWINRRFIEHGDALNVPNVVQIDRVTTFTSDYKRLPQGLTKLKFFKTNRQKALNDPENLFNSDAYVAVIKKNPAPLLKLIQDLTPIKGDLGQLPVLIIDDESDQASVDTTNPDKWKANKAAEKKRTRINGLLTQILDLCPRAQYVGYTATPFANVFVDPDDEQDLFPADFVLSLSRPPGYMGVQAFHDMDAADQPSALPEEGSNEWAHVRALEGDYEERADLRDLEMQGALDSWVLAGAIKKLREARDGLSFRHHTMLVHESVTKASHAEAAEHVRRIWRESRFNSSAGLARLQLLFETDYAPVMRARANGLSVPENFAELRTFISAALSEMTADADPILVVNSDKEVQNQQKKLDFEQDRVWRILIGGTQLSRGFTVEGLTVSYFRRKAGQADTLMQAGRWFGFRAGYQDLVRLYIRRDEKVDLYHAFEALLMDEESFRAELAKYEGFDDEGKPVLEPRHIPPLVSQHLPWLKPTARNKMWNAVIASKASAGSFQDLFTPPPRGSQFAAANTELVASGLLRHTVSDVDLPYTIESGSSGTERFKLGVVTHEEFMKVLTGLKWHPDYGKVINPLLRFLADSAEGGLLNEWVVAWHQPRRSTNRTLLSDASVSGPVVTRERRTGARIDVIGSDRKHTAALLPAALGRDLPSMPGRSGRGVVLVYVADDRADDLRNTAAAELGSADVMPLLSVAVPQSAVPRKKNYIQWTVEVASKADAVAVSQE